MRAPRSFATALLATVLAGAIAGAHAAAPLPHLKPGERPAPGSTESELWYGTDQAEKYLRQAPIVVHDPNLQRYVEGVVCRVTGDYCKDLRVYIVDVPVFNASMAPNGATMVFTGALLRMRDESELAVVLGHEFAHYKARHSLESWQTSRRASAFLSTFGLVSWVGGVPLAGEIAYLGGIGGLSKQSRDNEREADRLGYAASTAQGYDPQGGVRVWERMLREARADKRFRDGGLFASHPKTEERLTDMRAAAAQVPIEHPITNVEAYRTAVRPFLQRWMEAELSRRTYDTSLQVLSELKQDATPDTAALATFYLAEAHRRRNKDDDMAQAGKLYAEALALPDPPVAAWREQGLYLQAHGDLPGAIAALRRYLDAAPEAGDAALMRQTLERWEKTP
jgi:predicted Zn-dependent protease